MPRGIYDRSKAKTRKAKPMPHIADRLVESGHIDLVPARAGYSPRLLIEVEFKSAPDLLSKANFLSAYCGNLGAVIRMEAHNMPSTLVLISP